jgi:hypothetical protein
MTQEFIPYQEALEMKQLGFDEPCLAYYDEQGKHYPMGTVVGPNTIHFGTFLPSIQKGASALLTGSPLYQQAFRWFREKYFLDAEIYVNHELGHKFYHYLILQLVRGNIEWKNINTIKFKTYEEAELACLRKLIELVK